MKKTPTLTEKYSSPFASITDSFSEFLKLEIEADTGSKLEENTAEISVEEPAKIRGEAPKIEIKKNAKQ